MKLTVFGATGRTGAEVLRRALRAGHHVTAVVRDPARLGVPGHIRLDVVTADVFDSAAIAPAVNGSDVAISALGPRGRGPSTICRDGTEAIMGAMRSAGVRRLVVVSNSGMHTAGDGPFVARVVKPLLIRMLREGYDDMHVMEERVAASGLDWTIVRPPRLTGQRHTGNIATSFHGNVRRGFTIGRPDLADYLLRAAVDDSLIGTAVSVAAGR